jgi:hypothetical protein
VNVPDYISPIVGYRLWRWDTGVLKSLNGQVWMPGRPLAAACRRVAACVCPAHDAPQLDCRCGVYAAKTFDHLRTLGCDELSIRGKVNLWGRVVEHERGWRAQFAYPQCLYLASHDLPFTLAELDARLRSLTAFGADIFLLTMDKGGVLLWRSGPGYDGPGVDYLVSNRKRYYERLLRDRTPKPGDRIALRGRGIGIVLRDDEQSVVVRLNGRCQLRIARSAVALNQQNMRWECEETASGYMEEEQN